MSKVRYEVSDGVMGDTLIIGYFRSPIEAVMAWIRAHGPSFPEECFDNLLVYQADGETDVYAVTVKADKSISLYPIPKG